jgi:hypothetical protein
VTGPSYTAGGGARTPFGSNEYLRSTQDVKKESYTFAAASLPTETIDGVVQKVLLPGEVLAKITSGADAGKVGVFQALATDGREVAANIVGINDTWLPWQLMEHDCTVAATYEATVYQAWCFERDAAGARVTLTNTTIDAMRGTKGLSIMAK